MHPNLRVIKNLKNSFVKELYDETKTPEDNLIAMGLAANANGYGQPRHYNKVSAEEVPKQDSHPGFVGYVDSIPDKELKQRNIMTEQEIDYVKANMKKHGENVTAMARDIKTNYNQLTEVQLSKLLKRFQELQE
jgi:hypothetical protein